MSETWRMFAQRRHASAEGREFFHFGPRGWAALGDGAGVAEIDVVEDEHGSYWGWLDNGGQRPVYISGTFAALEQAYRAGVPADDISNDETEGRGRIVRLRVDEVGAVVR